MLFALFGMTTWRAYRRMTRRADELSVYAAGQAVQLERLAAQLNQHGFQLERTLNQLAPKLEAISTLLDQPLIAAAMPWVLRRILRRPYRRR